VASETSAPRHPKVRSPTQQGLPLCTFLSVAFRGASACWRHGVPVAGFLPTGTVWLYGAMVAACFAGTGGMTPLLIAGWAFMISPLIRYSRVNLILSSCPCLGSRLAVHTPHCGEYAIAV